MRVLAGSLDKLQADGRLLTKLGATPVVVLWHDERAWAIDDRCPHMGFPLHRGTVEAGLVTCHWHHARFDLESGCTLDPFADDATAYDVELDGDDVFVATREQGDPRAHLRHRLREGLEDGLTLVTAKSVLGLLEAGVDAGEIVREGVDFGVTYRDNGWGSGLTVLTAMANLLPHLDADDRPLALVHGLRFVSRDTRNRPPRFALSPLATERLDGDRLDQWYRRFIDTRSSDAAERTLATAIASRPIDEVERTMFAAATDHVFLDIGHTLDFTNKAVEVLGHVGASEAGRVLPTLVRQTASAGRSEESAAWRHPHDLAALLREAEARLPELAAAGETRSGEFHDVAGLGWAIVEHDDPTAVVAAVLDAIVSGASPEQLGRAVAFAAALRITRFHTQNDHGDWDAVHHSFTCANGLHQALARNPSPELRRGVLHGALAVFLDRFLNVPAARLPHREAADLGELAACWDVHGMVDEAGGIAYGWLRGGGDPAALMAALGGALLAEDPEFHWYQVVEAGIRQHLAWPAGSEEGALVLAGIARFLAAHTPTRREIPKIVQIAGRLRRGDALYEEDGAP